MTESIFVNIIFKQKLNLTLIYLFCLLPGVNAYSQIVYQEKQVTSYVQSWFSINSNMRFSDSWGMVADFHVRRDDFLKYDYFYFFRAGATYWISDKYPVILGVAHLWQAPPDGYNTWLNENRIYQQWSAVQKQGIVAVLHRIRFEQRWKDLIRNDEIDSDKSFSLRLRYLASFEVKIFANPKIPKLIVSDEVLVQFGESIVYNTFDQNRFFLGLKVPVSGKLNFDIGYMNIFQQKPTGYQYALSHVFRLFFYYSLDFTKNKQDFIYHDGSE